MTAQSAVIGSWCIAPSAFAGGMRPTGYGSLIDHCSLAARPAHWAGKNQPRDPLPVLDKTLRSVRAWIVLMKSDGIYLYL
jgi:hypothetical protein